MNDIIKFETAPRPLTSGKSKFPYEAVIKSLQDLDSTKSLVFPEKECKYNNIQMLRKLANTAKLPYVKYSHQCKRIYLWMNHE